MRLELDVGNSRIKWRMSEGSEQKRGVLAGRSVEESISPLLLQIEQALSGSISRILVSSVRDAAFDKALQAALLQSFAIEAEFARSLASCGALQNGYDKPETLGVDRWLALIAAYDKAQGACCILDCGTTITLDMVSAEGKHLGGFIVPGLQLQKESLGQRSEALRVASTRAELQAGKNTAAAIGNGVLTMVLGFVHLNHKRLESRMNEPAWYFTGGDAELLASYIEWEHKLEPDLVLDGLALALD